MLDVGAESTRPGATPLSPSEEWQRLSPVLEKLIALARSRNKIISLDTRHAENAAKAIALGIGWINDVSGLDNSAMINAVRESTVKLVIMHSLSIPADPAVTLPPDADAVEEVMAWAEKKLAALAKEKISRERIILDPGIGFGKTKAQSLDLVMRAEELKKTGAKILIGHSRKSFLTLFTDAPADERDDVTLVFSSLLMRRNIDFVRVHNVSRHVTLRKLLTAGI